MKTTAFIIAIALFAAVAEYFFPWWSLAIVSFAAGIMSGFRPGRAFATGFAGIGIMWLAFIVYRDLPNHHILATRMSVLFFKTPNYPLFEAINVLLGGLLGGLATLSGSLFVKKSRR